MMRAIPAVTPAASARPNPRRLVWCVWAALALGVAPAANATPGPGAEVLARGQVYVIPALTYCTSGDAGGALARLRQDGDLSGLPPGCFHPDAADFAARFKGFIPDHKVSGMAVMERLSQPNRFGRSPCPDPATGTPTLCVVRVIRSGFIAGTFIGPGGTRTPAFIEVGFGIEVADPQSGSLQFAPLDTSRGPAARHAS